MSDDGLNVLVGRYRNHLVECKDTEGLEALQKEYYEAKVSREFLMRRVGAAEDPSKIFEASKTDKKRFNELSLGISRQLSKAWAWQRTNGIDPKENHGLEFLGKPERSSGWYQNRSGKLFHYDGVVWDEVPNERMEELEFLG